MNRSNSTLNGDSQLLLLLKKYDRQGPRYTSYPPAPLFSESFGANQFREAVIQTNTADERSGISLYFHLPFCDTLCYFCGCTMLVSKNRERIREYNKYLTKEIELIFPLLGEQRRVVQLHWGGGTPTHLTPDEINNLGKHIRKIFLFGDQAEASVEIDPRELTFEHLDALKNVGFNRISMGVQDFKFDVQQAVNRIQSEELTRQAVGWCRELGFESLNIDLIYGLPYQTSKSFESTLDKIIDISPDRLAVYNFAYVPWIKPHQKLVPKEMLPTPDIKLEIFTMTIKKLTQAGYVYIGMDHFAKPHDELAIAQHEKTLHRNFQGYSTKAGCDMYGLGMSSISHFSTFYAQNAKTLKAYYSAIKNKKFATCVGYQMTKDDEIRKYVIMRLMCDLILEIQDVEEKFNIQFDEYFRSSLKNLTPLIEDELIIRTGQAFAVNTIGRLFLRNIAMCFDAYLANFKKEQSLFSRTV